MSREYTFEDWLAGKIKTEDVTPLMLRFLLNKNNNIDEPCLPPDEFDKIRQVQKETFHRAIEITSQTKIRLAKQAIQNRKVRNPKNWLKLEIEKAEKFISDNPELEKRFECFETEHGGIRPDEVERINLMHEKFKSDSTYKAYVGFSTGKKGNSKPLRLIDLYINKIYLEALKEMQAELNDKPDPRTKYHRDNYWPTAYRIYESDQARTWDDVYEIICKEMKDLGLPLIHNSVDSFKTMRKEYQKKHGYPKKET